MVTIIPRIPISALNACCIIEYYNIYSFGKYHVLTQLGATCNRSLNGRHTSTTDLPLTPDGEIRIRATGEALIGEEKLICTSLLAHMYPPPNYINDHSTSMQQWARYTLSANLVKLRLPTPPRKAHLGATRTLREMPAPTRTIRRDRPIGGMGLR